MTKWRLAVATTIAAVFPASAWAAPPVEAYGNLPAMSQPTISPSGHYFAALRHDGQKETLAVYESGTLKTVGSIGAGERQKINSLGWYSDDRILLFVKATKDFGNGTGRVGDIYDLCRVISVARDGSNPVRLLSEGEGSLIRASTCDIVSMRGPEPNTILLAAISNNAEQTGASRINRERWHSHTVFSVNVLTGEAKAIESGSGSSTFDWMADANGHVRMRFDADGDKFHAFARLDGSTDWVEVHSGPLFDFQNVDTPDSKTADFEFIGFGAEPNKLYVSLWAGDHRTFGVFDLASHTLVSTIPVDQQFDMRGPISLRSGRIVGAWIDRWSTQQVFFSDDWKQLQALLAASYPEDNVQVVSSSDDLSKHIIYVEGPQWPAGAFQIVDLKTNESGLIGDVFPGIKPGMQGVMRVASYTARDGQKINAYLTLPPGSSGKGLPAVVMPHGGPASRDDGDFDYLSQFFASRGYAVLQPEFRGSTGFGSAFARAGEKQWGLKMQDDVSDGVAYLTSNGVADGKRICIVGWSYGGYAALAGATLTPDLYRCTIAVAGVSDLSEMLEDEIKTAGWRNANVRYWRNHIGDPKKDKAKLDAASPAQHALNVRGPVLLIHGSTDTIVPVQQSRGMADALKRAGKAVEFLELSGEGHSLDLHQARVTALTAMEAFILKNNPPH